MDSQAIVPPVPQTDQPVSEPTNMEVLDTVQPQVADALQKSKNVLVTVGANPSVDELASALGLTVLLGKIGKHATAVFSGKIPPAIEFLDPEKTFENTVDSLRDFIIALDKEKADKLRYKVEDDVVKIFITPYRTVISEKDLEYSQGDFNVDAVIALGVEKKEELDKAITAHGRILHNATFITVNAGEVTTSLGTINWSDATASSIAEMLVRLSDALGDDVLDAQISTAFLTGVVAETNRFSNEKTTPKVMTMSAQLMAKGANQQLIASNLRQEGMISESVRLQQKGDTSDNGEMVLTHKAPKNDTKGGAEKQPARASDKTQLKPPVVKPESVSKKEANTAPSRQPEKPAPIAQPPVSLPTPTEELRATLQEASSEQKITEHAGTVLLPEGSAEDDTTATRKVITPPSEAVQSPEGGVPASPRQGAEGGMPVITPPPARDAIEKPQFGGALNSFADAPDAVNPIDQPATPDFTLSHESNGVEAAMEDAVEAARKAVEDAAVEPPHQRLESIGSSPLPEVNTPMPSEQLPPVAPIAPPLQPLPEPLTPVAPESPTSPVVMPSAPINPVAAPSSTFAPPVPIDNSLPPMPPLPTPVDGALPPLPPLPPVPSQQAASPAPSMEPQTAPSFLQDLQQSQNGWTQAGQSVVEAKAAANAERQAKIDERLQDYDQAVNRNRELQGLPPVNNPNGSGFPPLMPPQLPQ